MIGPENSHHSLNQSETKLKPITTWSPAFSRALGSSIVFVLSSHWLFKAFHFLLICHRAYFGFSFTTLNRKELCQLLGNIFFVVTNNCLHLLTPSLLDVTRKKKTYPYIVAFPSRRECKRGNTENWLPIRRGVVTGTFYCDKTKILLTPPPSRNKNWLVPVNSPSQKKVLGSLWQLEELMEESSAQTDQPNHLSWRLYFSWHLWARFLLLNLKWHKNIIYCFHTLTTIFKSSTVWVIMLWWKHSVLLIARSITGSLIIVLKFIQNITKNVT